MPLAPSRASDETNTMLRYLDISSIKPHFVPGLWEWRHGQLRKGVKSTRCYSEGICSGKKNFGAENFGAVQITLRWPENVKYLALLNTKSY